MTEGALLHAMEWQKQQGGCPSYPHCHTTECVGPWLCRDSLYDPVLGIPGVLTLREPLWLGVGWKQESLIHVTHCVWLSAGQPRGAGCTVQM